MSDCKSFNFKVFKYTKYYNYLLIKIHYINFIFCMKRKFFKYIPILIKIQYCILSIEVTS